MARVTINRTAIRDILNNASMMDEALRDTAEQVLAAAQSIAPRQSGDYLAGLEIRPGTTDRYKLDVGSSARHALAVEARHGVLQRALDG